VTPFNVTAADMAISFVNFLGTDNLVYELTRSNFLLGTCTPAECQVTFGIKNVQAFYGIPFVPYQGTYDIYLQLNLERIWVPWITQGQQTVQMWQHTVPYVWYTNWNEVGSIQRTVLADPIAAVPLH
jgi:hypothetical protein